jgi:hypothetical protein
VATTICFILNNAHPLFIPNISLIQIYHKEEIMTFSEKIDAKLNVLCEYKTVLGPVNNQGEWSLYNYLTEKLRLKVEANPNGLVAVLGPKARLQIVKEGDVITATNTYSNQKLQANANQPGFVIDMITKLLGAKPI